MTYFGTLNKITHAGLDETFVPSLQETTFLLDPVILPAEIGSTPLPGLPNPNHYPKTSQVGTTVQSIMPVSYATWTEPPTYDAPMVGISMDRGGFVSTAQDLPV